jgi:hypothetical protein
MIEDSQDPIEIKNPEPKNQQNKISNIEIKNKNCSIKIDNYKLKELIKFLLSMKIKIILII